MSCVINQGKIDISSPALCKFLQDNKFLVVKTFTSEQSEKIKDYLNPSKKDLEVYFSREGSLLLRDKTFDTDIKTDSYINPLTNIPVTVISGAKKIKLKSANDKQAYFTSTYNLWLLYYDKTSQDAKITLYYNPFHRPEFTNYYKKEPYNSVRVFKQYCDIVGKDADQFCTCLISTSDNKNDFCVNDYFGDDINLVDAIKGASKEAYNRLEGNCPCLNSTCNPSYKSALLPDSFIPTYLTDSLQNCVQDLTITICNSQVSSGGNLDTQKVAIQQSCSAETSTTTGGKQSSAEPTTPAPPTAPVTPTVAVTPTTPVTPPLPSNTEDGSFFDKYKYYIIAAVIVLIILLGIGGYFIFSSSSTSTNSSSSPTTNSSS